MSHIEEDNKNTEADIKAAAKKLFLKKGLAGARMQEIADTAGIGRTALHYYFRNKEKLYEVVWKDAFTDMIARTAIIFNGNYSTIEKMEAFIDGYFDKAMSEPELDLFMLNELNNNPEIMKNILTSADSNSPFGTLLQSIETSVKNGEMNGPSSQILVTFISMCFFSFAGRPMIQDILMLTNDQYMQLMQERKTYLKTFLKHAFKP